MRLSNAAEQAGKSIECTQDNVQGRRRLNLQNRSGAKCEKSELYLVTELQ